MGPPPQRIPILKIMMLGIVLAAITLSGVMYAADSKTVQLSHVQEHDDIQIHEVACSDTHVPMISPSGMSVCVFEQSVTGLESMGFGFTGGTFDMFPIKMPTGFDGSAFIPPGYSSPPGFSSPPVISMSHLPEIG